MKKKESNTEEDHRRKHGEFDHGDRALFHGFTHLTRGDRVRYPRI
jgi:hypothetical protein